MAKGSLINKQNRLDRLTGLLRQDDLWTMQRLSNALDVSERTLLRDINELKHQGYPIETERGRGGGVSLDHRWGVNKLHLNHEEIINLLVSLAITESLKSPLLGQQVRSIRQKITHGFPENQRKNINQLRKRILFGDKASKNIIDTYQVPLPHITAIITRSFFDLEIIEMNYTSGKGEMTKRQVEPQYLFFNWPVWYLLGWDHLRQAPRVFRIDRISNITATKQPFALRKKAEILQGLEDYFGLL